MTEYHPQELDKKWQAHWAATNAFEVTEDPSRPKFYCLEMFAYPSGHAHVGHVRELPVGNRFPAYHRLCGSGDCQHGYDCSEKRPHTELTGQVNGPGTHSPSSSE